MFRSFPRRAATAALVPSLLVLAFAGCGDDAAGPSETDEPVVLSISLDAASAPAGGSLTISGIPADTDVWAVVTSGATGATGLGFVDRTALRGSGDQLIVPLHPDDPMVGGAVTIEVTNGTNVTSNQVALDIGPLPAAPGAFAAAVDDLQLLLDGWLAQAGTDRATLRSTPIEMLPVDRLQLLFVHNMLDRPDNPNSLRAFADGDIPLLAGEELDRNLLDALVGASAVRDQLAAKLAFVDTLTAPELPQGEPAGTLRARALGRAGGCFAGPSFGIGPDNCPELSAVMSYQGQLAFEAASAAQNVESTVQGIVFPILGFTGAAAYATGVGAVLWATGTIESASIGLYPSVFLNDATTFDADPLQFPEDFTEDGLWSGFRVTAASEGWVFDQAILEAILQLIGAAGAGPGEIVGELPPGAGIQQIRDVVKGFVLSEATNQAVGTLAGDGETLSYCPQTWAGIDCTGEPYSIGRSTNNAIIDVTSADRSFRPTEIGGANLIVETGPGQFGFAATGHAEAISCEEIQVFIDPTSVTIGTDQTVNFSVRVENAIDPSVEWTCTYSEFAPDGGEAALNTPSDPWSIPIEVRARSTASTGLRARPAAPVRQDNAFVTYGDSLIAVQVDPGYECVSNDESVDLTALVIGIEEPSVTWSLEEGIGTITSTGPLTATYTAASTGTVDARIRAIVDDHPEIFDDATVRVSACTCRYDLVVTGPLGWIESGGDIAYAVFDPTGQGVGAMNWFIETENDYPLVGASVVGDEKTPMPVPGDTGAFDMSFTYAPGPSTTYRAGPGVEGSDMTLTIDEYTSAYMTGSMFGTAVLHDEEGNVISSVIVEMDFRAGLFDGSWPCE